MSNSKSMSAIDENFRAKDVVEKAKAGANLDANPVKALQKTFFNLPSSENEPQDDKPKQQPQTQSTAPDLSNHLEKEIQELKALVKTLESGVENYKGEASKWQNQSKGTQTKLNKANERVKELEAMLKVVNHGGEPSSDQKFMENYTKMENAIKEYKKEIKSLRDQIKDYDDKMEKMIAENSKALESAEELESVREDLGRKEEEISGLKTHYESVIDNLKNEVTKSQAVSEDEDTRVQKVITNSNREKALLESQIKELTQSNLDLRNTLETNSTELQQLRDSQVSNQGLEEKIKQLEATILEYEQKEKANLELIETLNKSIADYEALSDTALKLQDELNNRIIQKEEEIEKLKGELIMAQTTATTAQSNELSNTISQLEGQLISLDIQLQARVSEAEAYKSQANNFVGLVSLYNSILESVSQSNPEMIETFEKLLLERIGDKPDLVQAILSIPQ